MEWITPRRLSQLGMLGMNCRNVDFINRYNPRHLFPLVDNKLKTKLLAREYGLPMPGLRAVIAEQHAIQRAEPTLGALDHFVLKPARGSGGKGIMVVVARDGEEYVRSSGSRLGFGDVRRHMSNTLAGLYSLGGHADEVIVEDVIVPDESVSGYSFEGVPDVRVIVFKGYPVMAMVRLSTHASDGKANLHQGAIGVGLALSDGSCLQAVQHSERVTHHPDNGLRLADIRITHWREMLLLAARCHDMTGLGYIGTDMVLDRERGPQLLELNARPGLAIQIANGRGLLPRLRHIETLPERPARSAEERVRYAMEELAAL